MKIYLVTAKDYNMCKFYKAFLVKANSIEESKKIIVDKMNEGCAKAIYKISDYYSVCVNDSLFDENDNRVFTIE